MKNVAKPQQRCVWGQKDAQMCAYHDEEWGVPERDSRALWEKLMLDGFQAGLSWQTILRKRDAFRKAFKDFDPVKVAAFSDKKVEDLMQDEKIIRSRSKILATIGNAKAYLKMEAEGEDFAQFVWGMAGGKPIQNKGKGANFTVPVSSELSIKLSKVLKKKGFKFCGPVIVYAWLQACGVINDHHPDCFRQKECRDMAKDI